MSKYQEYFKRNALWEKSSFFIGLIFIVTSCFTKLGVLLSSSSLQMQLLGISGGVLCLVPVFKPAWLKPALFYFALSFPLYGSLPYSAHTFLFEFYLSILSLVLLLRLFKNMGVERKKVVLPFLLFSCFLLASTSLLLLPVQNILWKIVLWDWAVFWNAAFFATPELPLYSVAALHRFALFGLFVTLLASCPRGREFYQTFFVGLLAGALWASVAGIIEYYKFFDLSWFREVAGSGSRLQSVFANPGWFAEFLAVTIPYVLLGFASPRLKTPQKICLFGLLIICEIAIILTYSRTGWYIYPLVLLVCWFFFYISKQADRGRFTWAQIAKVCLKLILSVPLTVFLSYFLIFTVFDRMDSADLQEKDKFVQRVNQIADPLTRLAIWSESFELVKEKPFFGLGYESYKYQNSILKKTEKEWDTPHNFYIQLLVSGGIAGLMLWGLVIFATVYLLVADLVRNKAYLNIAVILSIVAFHLYGLAQTMQYIPMIWFLAFLNIGYAMTVNENVLPLWIRNNRNVLALLVMVVVSSALIAYASDFESKKLAVKEELEIFSLDQNQNNYLGFYAAENWGELGTYRWTGSSAIIKLPSAEVFEFTIACSAPDLSDKPVVLTVFEGNRQIDEIAFYQPQSITKQYFIPEAISLEKELHFSVSRTWNLKKSGIANDSRNLGVAISEPKILEVIPRDGIGFYDWEKWQGVPLPGEANGSFDYRWTGGQAVFHPMQLAKDKVVYFRAGQPGLAQDPLLVQIRQKGRLVKEVKLANSEWHRLSLQDTVNVPEPFTILVTRTWNPKKDGYGEDSRTLGVAVAGLVRLEPL